MQGHILTMGVDRSVILGDDDVHYTFTSLEWQNDDMKPEVGMRVDFEVRGSDAADIYPIPGAPPMPPMPPRQPSAPAPSRMSGVSSSPQHTASTADERFKAMLGRVHTELDARYSPIREKIGNYGAIAVGVALLIVSTFILFDILEAILDLIAMIGMLAGVAMAAIGVFMLGKDEGWWDKNNDFSDPGAVTPTSQGDASKSYAEVERNEVTTGGDTDIQHAGVAEGARRMKNCQHCGEAILYKAIKCRYCGSEVPSETD